MFISILLCCLLRILILLLIILLIIQMSIVRRRRPLIVFFFLFVLLLLLFFLCLFFCFFFFFLFVVAVVLLLSSFAILLFLCGLLFFSFFFVFFFNTPRVDCPALLYSPKFDESWAGPDLARSESDKLQPNSTSARPKSNKDIILNNFGQTRIGENCPRFGQIRTDPPRIGEPQPGLDQSWTGCEQLARVRPNVAWIRPKCGQQRPIID